jgi:hypothetical protein
MAQKKKNKKTVKRSITTDQTRLLWVVFASVVMLVLLLDFFVEPHAEFGLEGTRFFHAWFGFAACAAIVVLSKWLGVVLKKPEDFYKDESR